MKVGTYASLSVSTVRVRLITVLSAGEYTVAAKDKPAKRSTKTCPHCGCDKLILLYSLNKKICNNCGAEIPWYLDEGQKPLLG